MSQLQFSTQLAALNHVQKVIAEAYGVPIEELFFNQIRNVVNKNDYMTEYSIYNMSDISSTLPNVTLYYVRNSHWYTGINKGE